MGRLVVCSCSRTCCTIKRCPSCLQQLGCMVVGTSSRSSDYYCLQRCTNHNQGSRPELRCQHNRCPCYLHRSCQQQQQARRCPHRWSRCPRCPCISKSTLISRDAEPLTRLRHLTLSLILNTAASTSRGCCHYFYQQSISWQRASVDVGRLVEL